MRTICRPLASCVAAFAWCLAAAPLAADVIYDTGEPGGWLGFWGPDVCADQSVAVRITPDAAYTLEEVGLWLMNNDWSGETHPQIRVTIRPDSEANGESRPGDAILDEMSVTVTTVGWDPVLETAASVSRPQLCPGENYWIVAESSAPCGLDGVWVMAGEASGFSANTDGGQWQPGGTGAVPATRVSAAPALSGDMNADGRITLDDVTPFARALIDTPEDPAHTGRADLNCDGRADGEDLPLFLAALLTP